MRLLMLVAAALEVELMGTVEAFVCFVRRYSIEFMQGFGDHSSYDILSILLFYVWNRYSVLLL